MLSNPGVKNQESRTEDKDTESSAITNPAGQPQSHRVNACGGDDQRGATLWEERGQGPRTERLVTV